MNTQTLNQTHHVTTGQVVSTNLYGLARGVIFSIHGDQRTGRNKQNSFCNEVIIVFFIYFIGILMQLRYRVLILKFHKIIDA